MPIKKNCNQTALQVVKKLTDAGYETYIVGGAVRDLLLGTEPKDYDIATAATPEEAKAVFGRRARIIGRRFRLVHVYLDRQTFEVSTFRREPSLEERRGRKTDSGLMVWSDNAYGTLEEDARRRDFTVNALFFDPTSKNQSVIDLVGGLQDLKEKRVRTIGVADVRIQEDPVRMLRACKLQGQYGLQMTPELSAALAKHSPMLELSSHARLLEELYKILKRPFAAPTLDACREKGVLSGFLPMLNSEWESDAGKQCRSLLTIRDTLLRDKRIYPSRITGLVGLLFPFVLRKCREDAQERLWQNRMGIDREIHHFIRQFFSSYNLPRVMTARTRDVLILQPKFLQQKERKRLLQHPEYARGRDFFQVLAQGLALPPEAVDFWPEPQKRQWGREEGQPFSRCRRVRRPRRKRRPPINPS